MNRSQRNRSSSEGRIVISVHRALDTLDVFTPETPSVSVVEIEKKVRLSRPTVYRLLETLAAHGLIRVHGAPSRYSLDYTVGRLAQNWLAGMEPAVVGRPFAERLHDQTMETVLWPSFAGTSTFTFWSWLAGMCCQCPGE